MNCLKSAKSLILIMTCSKSAKFFKIVFLLFSVIAHVHIPVVLFLWLKITINFQKWVYRGMVDIVLLGILGLMHMYIFL